MQTIALFGQKGGAGKSTIAVHLAVQAMTAGRRVAMLDLDPQQSSLAWSRVRAAHGMKEPTVVALPPTGLASALEAARNDEIELVIVDTPPHASVAAASTVRLVDLVLVPVQPTPMDASALPATLALLEKHPRWAFVLSRCPLRAPETAEMRELLARHGRPVLGPINDRRQFFRACIGGQAVTEFEPGGAAANEISVLYNATQELLA